MSQEQRSLVPYSNEWRLILKSKNEGSSVFYDEDRRKLMVMPSNVSNNLTSNFETGIDEVIPLSFLNNSKEIMIFRDVLLVVDQLIFLRK